MDKYHHIKHSIKKIIVQTNWCKTPWYASRIYVKSIKSINWSKKKKKNQQKKKKKTLKALWYVLLSL